MRHILAILGTAAVALAIAAVVVGVVGDRETLVPPPEAVAEEFVRQLVTRRAVQVIPLLSDRLRELVTPEQLDRAGIALEAELGEVTNVGSETEWIDGDRAAASSEPRGARGRTELRFEFSRENGKWTIDALDAKLVAARPIGAERTGAFGALRFAN